MTLELTPELVAPLALAVLHFIAGVFIRPRVSPDTWAQLGHLGAVLDVTFGNYAHTRNVDPEVKL